MRNNRPLTMPAEWEAHERTFIAWPVRSSMVWTENADKVCRGYSEVVKAISRFEPVTVLAGPDTAKEAKSLCGDAAQILVIPHNDGWFRDSGPTFVRDGAEELRGIHWKFNAWGEKYKPYDLDAAAAGLLLKELGVPAIAAPFVLEGGSIHTDGEGTLLTTEQCLLNPNRNPGLTREQIEAGLREYLNVSKILWLKNGLFGDETDGHIDNVACFAKPGTVIIQTCSDPEDPNYAVTAENLACLTDQTDAAGRRLEIIEIGQPPARFYRGKRLTLSYLNFYLVNGGLILPVFGGDASETDGKAVRTLQSVYPGRTVVTVDGMALIKEGGNVHCITQQMPAESGRNRRNKV